MEENLLIKNLRDLLAKDFIHRKSIESELYKSEEKYRLLLDQLTDPIYFTSIEGKFLEFNRATTVLLGYSEEELRNLPVYSIYADPSDRKKFTNLLKTYQELQDYEIKLLKKDGEIIDCLVTSSLRKSLTGETVGYQGIIRDITLRKKSEQLERAKQLAENANKFKAEFLANMSHEIRTPLHAIVGMVELMKRTEINEQQRKYLHAIDISGENLLQIINDILDFSKIEAGKLHLEEKTFSIRENVNELLSTIKYKAEEKGLNLVTQIDEDIPPNIIGDSLRLNQILLNLVSNAIKFTTKGEIKVQIRLLEITDTNAHIFFSVKDTGIGIDQEKLSTIFESFTQATTDTTRIYGGTGLGLTIVKKLIDMQGGAIMVKSRINEGSEFLFEITFKLPKGYQQRIKVEKADESFVELGAIKILLAEDHPINQIVTTELIKSRWKHAQIETAVNGKIALEKIKTTIYDLVLMDVQMPEMDGHTATRIIRSNANKQIAEIPILAFTAYATTGEAEKCMEAGMDDYISKPVDTKILEKKLIALLRRKNYFSKQNLGSEDLIPKNNVSVTKDLIQIDLQYFNTVTEEDQELKIKMLRIMMDETPDEMEKLKKYMQEKNWDNLRAIAHKMKSSMQFLGMKNTLDLVKTIERSAKDRTELYILPVLVEQVIEDCNSAMKSLQAELEKIQ